MTSNTQTAEILKNQRESASMINNLLEQSKDALLCGPTCQQRKTANELEQKYISAKTELITAPTDLENAKKNYVVFTEGDSAYKNMLEGELKDKANKLGTLISEKFKEEIEQGLLLNIYLNSEIINSNNTIELYKAYLSKNLKTEELIKYSQGDILTNDRKSYYENQENDNLKGWYSILLTIYYILALIFFALFILMKSNMHLILKLLILIILIIFPYIINPITLYILYYLKQLVGLFPKDVYLNN